MTDLREHPFAMNYIGDIYFKDIGLRVHNARKYDLLEVETPIASLVTNGPYGVIKCEEQLLRLKKPSGRFSANHHTRLMDGERLMALFDIRRKGFFFWIRKTYELIFVNGPRYTMRIVGKNEAKKLDVPSGYHFFAGDRSVGRLNTHLSRWGFAWNGKKEYKGNIQCDSSVSRLEILCFLQVMELAINDYEADKD
ncbi:MAG: hypothetical protein JST39_22580 [Bacteroidetes bacterium]|nr:hypothetical protein [Bacteroidota bacterium]